MSNRASRSNSEAAIGTGKNQPARASIGRRLVWLTAGLLFVLHHDWWYWDNPTIVLGVLPIGMAYHVGFSIASALLWLAATRFAWPTHLEQWAVNAPSQRPPTPPASS